MSSLLKRLTGQEFPGIEITAQYWYMENYAYFWLSDGSHLFYNMETNQCDRYEPGQDQLVAAVDIFAAQIKGAIHHPVQCKTYFFVGDGQCVQFDPRTRSATDPQPVATYFGDIVAEHIDQVVASSWFRDDCVHFFLEDGSHLYCDMNSKQCSKFEPGGADEFLRDMDQYAEHITGVIHHAEKGMMYFFLDDERCVRFNSRAGKVLAENLQQFFSEWVEQKNMSPEVNFGVESLSGLEVSGDVVFSVSSERVTISLANIVKEIGLVGLLYELRGDTVVFPVSGAHQLNVESVKTTMEEARSIELAHKSMVQLIDMFDGTLKAAMNPEDETIAIEINPTPNVRQRAVFRREMMDFIQARAGASVEETLITNTDSGFAIAKEAGVSLVDVENIASQVMAGYQKEEVPVSASFLREGGGAQERKGSDEAKVVEIQCAMS